MFDLEGSIIEYTSLEIGTFVFFIVVYLGRPTFEVCTGTRVGFSWDDEYITRHHHAPDITLV